MNERERIELLRRLLEGDRPSSLRVGIGDDAAVLETVAEPLVWSVDAMVEEVHFRRAWLSSSDLGYRATMAAASDLAAMGARPLAVLSSLILPSDFDDDALAAVAAGQAEACARLGTAVVGGNLSRGAAISITTTVLGTSRSPLLRTGARAGDLLLVAGSLGMAAAGCRALAEGRDDEALRSAIAAWRRPEARIDDGLRAASVARAAVDVSDGLSLDAARLLAADLDLVLDPAALVAPDLARSAAALGADGLSLALSGGEDYALLVAAAAPLAGFRPIGRFEPGEGALLLERDGRRSPIAPGGYDHFDDS